MSSAFSLLNVSYENQGLQQCSEYAPVVQDLTCVQTKSHKESDLHFKFIILAFKHFTAHDF